MRISRNSMYVGALLAAVVELIYIEAQIESVLIHLDIYILPVRIPLLIIYFCALLWIGYRLGIESQRAAHKQKD